MKQFGFSKDERLTGKKRIENLFKNGNHAAAVPLRAFFCTTNEHNSVKLLVSVPKKCFKKAVLRNYHKRLIREAYRLNKQILTNFIEQKEFGTNIAIVLVTSEKQNFVKISEKTADILNKILISLQ